MNRNPENLSNRKMESALNHMKEAVQNLLAVYRFGSQAQGTANQESDVDLAFLAHHGMTPQGLFELRQDLAAILQREVDLIDLRMASTVIRMQVLSTGECLFSGDDRARDQFEMLVYSSYARLNEERSGILEDVRARGSVYAG
jgi:uncharacterized protein